MSKYIDFATVKQAVSIEQAVQKLALKTTKSGSQLRAACPSCKSGGERALAITPGKNLFYCFAAQAGGDQIQLAAHIRGESTKEAAAWLTGDTHAPEKSSATGKDHAGEQHGLQPLDYLDASHIAVEAVGFDQETAEALGIGYASKGIMRGTVAIPVRLPDGTLAGYVGIIEARLPARFHLVPANVVPFQKKAG